MAFIVGKGNVLARELWPQKIGQLDQDKHLDIVNLPKTRVVPQGEEELLEWLYVDPLAPGHRGHVYVRSDVEGADGMLELVVRVQGVIHELNVGLNGDWDKMGANAHRAMQRVTLVGGGCKDAFHPQWKALDDIKTVVSMMLGASTGKRANRMGSICLRRRVFTKVVHVAFMWRQSELMQICVQVHKNMPPSVVQVGEDPNGTIAAVGSHWRIVTRIRCGAQTTKGGVVPLHPLSLRVGDFVDVAVSVVASLTTGPSGRKCEVFYEPKTIIRLQTADSLKAILGPSRKGKGVTRGRDEAVAGPVTKRCALGDGISFTTDDGPDEGQMAE